MVSKQVTAERDRKAWSLRQKGWTEQRIAEELDVDQSTIHRGLERQEKKLAKSFAGRAEEVKARQTAQLEEIADEAMQAWERSKEPAESLRTVTKTVTIEGETPEGVKVQLPATETTTTFERRGQTGDARFLEQAQKALEGIRNIWGLNAPKEAKLLGDPDKPITVKVLKNVSLDDL